MTAGNVKSPVKRRGSRGVGAVPAAWVQRRRADVGMGGGSGGGGGGGGGWVMMMGGVVIRRCGRCRIGGWIKWVGSID